MIYSYLINKTKTKIKTTTWLDRIHGNYVLHHDIKFHILEQTILQHTEYKNK